MTVRQPPVQHIASVLVSVSVDDPDVPKLQNVWSVFYQALEAGGGLYEEDTGYISTSRSRPYVVVDVKDQETYLTQAVQEAVKSARPLAEVAAASVGAKLGPVLWVSTTRRPYDIDTSLPRIYEKEPKEDLSRVPITAAVTVTYKLLLDERAEQ